MSASAQSPAQVQAQTQAKARVERNAGWVANSWRAAVAAAASRSGETGADENAHNTAQPKAAAPARADVVAAAQPKPPTKAVSAREAAPSGAADQKRGAADQKQGARLVVATARPSAYRPSMRVGNRPVDIVTVRPTATEAAIATKAGERVSNDAPRVAAATPPSGRDAADIDTADETHDGDPSVSIALPVRAPEPPPRVRTAALRSTDADVAGSPRQPVTAPATRQTHTPAPDSRAAAQPVPRTRTEQADRRSQRLKRLPARRKLSERRAARRARIRRARAAARRRARAQARLRISKVQRIKRRRKRFTPARFFARVGNVR